MLQDLDDFMPPEGPILRIPSPLLWPRLPMSDIPEPNHPADPATDNEPDNMDGQQSGFPPIGHDPHAEMEVADPAPFPVVDVVTLQTFAPVSHNLARALRQGISITSSRPFVRQ